MRAFFNEITTQLTTYPGNLVYHLVLAFSVAAALAAIQAWQRTGYPQARRLLTGLGLLLLVRLGLFIAAGVAWQGLIPEHLLLPPIDRAAALLSLMIILWLWIFPEPARAADAAHRLLILLALALLGLTLAWWTRQGQDMPYNGSWPDFLGEIFQLVLLAGGLFSLLARRPAGWGNGLGMLLLLAAGHAAYLLLPTPDGDFQGVVRLSEMVAYPLLLALPLRLPLPAAAAAPSEAQVEAAGSASEPASALDSRLLQSSLALAAGTVPADLCPHLTHFVAHAAQADLCLLLAPPGETRQVPVLCAYDLQADRHLPAMSLDERKIPVLVSTLRIGRPVRLAAASTSPDPAALAQALGLSQVGNLLAVPLLAPDGTPRYALLLLSPVTRRAWTADDQVYLTEIARALAPLLQRVETQANILTDLERTRQELAAAQQESLSARQERQQMEAQLGTLLSQAAKDKAQAESLADLLQAQEAAQEKALSARPPLLKEPGAQAEIAGLQEELKLALEEVARLNAALAAAASQAGAAAAVGPGSIAAAAGIAGELSRPVASVIEHASQLLNGSAGALDQGQRRSLERIKVSAERMRGLLDDLLGALSKPETGPSSPVELAEVLSAVAGGLASRLQEKKLALQPDLPAGLPRLDADRAALERLLFAVLSDTAGAAPPGSRVSVTARLQRESGQPDFLLVRVADAGQPIPAAEIPRLFSELTPAASTRRSLAAARVLAESLHARLWVDSSPGSGNLVSLLLPVATSEGEEAPEIPAVSPFKRPAGASDRAPAGPNRESGR